MESFNQTKQFKNLKNQNNINKSKSEQNTSFKNTNPNGLGLGSKQILFFKVNL